MKPVNAIILADSYNNATSTRLTTFLLPRFPKILWQEPLTHRMLSRNSASSRAIPLKRVIEQIQDDPFIPSWTANQRGMVGADTLTDEQKQLATMEWLEQMDHSILAATRMSEHLNIAKQDANRLLEPWMRVPCIVSATEWDNFFNLRSKPDVQPDFRETVLEMMAAREASQPKVLNPGDWHIPFADRFIDDSAPLKQKLKISAARSARGSYANHFGSFEVEKDFQLCLDLSQDEHLSPLEHQAVAEKKVKPRKQRNYRGFYQFRHHIEDGVWRLEDLQG